MIELRFITKTLSLARALLQGKDVSEDRLRKRLKICGECDKAILQGELMRCGVCNCPLKEKGLINLARFEETDSYGCRHSKGSRWKEKGV